MTTHIYVATPAYGEVVSTAYHISFLATFMELSKRSIAVSQGFRYSSLLPRSRNELVADFLQHPTTTHLLFWDSDTGVEPNLLIQMIEFKKPVVGVAYPKKQYQWERLAEAGAVREPRDLMDFVIQQADPPRQQGAFVRAKRVGAGFLLVERSVFDVMAKAIPELRYVYRGRSAFAFFDSAIQDQTREYVSEDMAFCERWVDRCAGEIWCHVDAKIVHSGTHRFTGRYAKPRPSNGR